MAQDNQPNVTNRTKYREKGFADECHDADSEMTAPVVAYEFSGGRKFKVDHNKPYDQPK